MIGNPSPRQFRAARAWLNWSLDKAGERAGMSRFVVQRIEKGEPSVRSESIRAVRAAYEETGLVFVSFDGIAKRPG